MNANILTIDKTLAAPAGTTGRLRSANARHEEPSSSPASENEAVQTDSAPARTTDNTPANTGTAKSDKPAREFREVLREKVNEAPAKAQSTDQSDEHSAVSDPTKPEQDVPAWVADNILPSPQDEENGVAEGDSEPASELNQLIAGLKPEQSPPPTGHAVKATEIKALAATETGQLGLKTVLPDKSNGLNGLKEDSPEQALPPADAGVIPGTSGNKEKIVALDGAQAFGDEPDVGEKVSETLADTGKQTLAANQKPPIDTSTQSDPADAMPDAAKDSPSATPGAGESKNALTNGPQAPADAAAPSVAANLTEKQTPPAPDNLPKDTRHAGIHQAQVRSSDANSPQPTGDGSEAANAGGAAKAATIEVQISDGQGKDRGRQPADDGSPQDVSQILSHNNSSVQVTTQSVSPAANARSANLPGQSSSGDVSADIGRQILESIRGQQNQQGAEREITVRLNPPELGKVFIKLQEHQAGLTGVLEVSRPQTRFEIEHALPEIIRSLADSGIQVRRFDVTLSDQGRSEQDVFGGHSTANNGRYDHNPADQNAWAEETNLGVPNEWPANNYNYQNYSGTMESFVTDGSINMLI